MNEAVINAAKRVFNFSAGPATMPLPVLEKAQKELLSFNNTGISIIETSHRATQFGEVLESAKTGVRQLLNVPENYEILFIQGGATLQFSMIPLNFLKAGESADYILTGTWGEKAVKEARRCGNVNLIYSSKETGYQTVPTQDELKFDEDAQYIHYVSNETIHGVEFKYDLEGGNVPVICDASSNILSKPIDVSKYAMIYAGAQKNIGPSGIALVIIREDLLEKVPQNQHSLLDYRAIAKENSLLNTAPTFPIYMVDLVCQWLAENGGVSAIQKYNEEKAALLYQAIDGSDGYFSGHAAREARSVMNVTFRLPSEELDAEFCAEATKEGLDGLKGHRALGGVRASIYNAFPRQGVVKLIDFMQEFAQRNG